MGKKSRKEKKTAKPGENPLLSAPVICDHEFEGLVSFEELKSCTFLKRNKYGKIKREVWEDGKIVKKKNEKAKKPKENSSGSKIDNVTSKAKKPKSSKKKSKVDKANEDNNGLAVPGNKPSKRKKRKKKGNDVASPQCKKARYDNATFHGSNQSNKEKVDVSAWENIFTPPEVLEALAELGFSTPTEIQRLVLPAAIKGRMDIIGAAETGSGKTLAFGIPIIHGILSDRQRESEMEDVSDEDSGVENSDQDASGAIEVLNEGMVPLTYEDNDSDEDSNPEGDSEMEDSGRNAFSDASSDDENQENSVAEDYRGNAFSDASSDGEDPFDLGSESEEGEQGEEFGDALGCVKVIDNADFDFLEEKQIKKIIPQRKPLRALIVTPTRELAIQVKSHLSSVLVHTDIKMAVVVGGLASEKQERILSKGPEIVVGTPGRLWELLEQGNEHLNQLENIRYLAIDETDRMVERGHFEELQHLLERVNADETAKAKRQNFVFSATLTLVHTAPKRVKMKNKTFTMTSELKVKKLAKMIGLKQKPKVVDVTRKFGTAESLTESRINCQTNEKDYYLYYFLKQYPGRTLVFCNSIDCVRRLQNLFTLLQCEPLSLHASMHQKQRLKSLEKFSSSSQALLLATDVAARGLDIPSIQHVIHYQTPRTAETYIHRSGRTARATQEGLSVLFIDSSELSKYRQLCVTLNRATDLPPFPFDPSIMDQAKSRVNFARSLETREHSQRKARAEENWFKKAAEEAELVFEEEEFDDDEMRERDMKAAQMRRDNKNMRVKLMKMLSRPLISSDFSGKYPTQTGALVTPLYKVKVTDPSEVNSVALSVMKKESVEFSKLVKTVKIKPPVKKVNKRKNKGFEKRRLKLQKEKEKREKESAEED